MMSAPFFRFLCTDADKKGERIRRVPVRSLSFFDAVLLSAVLVSAIVRNIVVNEIVAVGKIRLIRFVYGGRRKFRAACTKTAACKSVVGSI